MIPLLVQHWREGYDVVYGTRLDARRRDRPEEVHLGRVLRVWSAERNAAAARYGDFRLMSRRALDALRADARAASVS
jgi:hypothetical protein